MIYYLVSVALNSAGQFILVKKMGIFHFPVDTFVIFYLGARAACPRMANNRGQAARAPNALKSVNYFGDNMKGAKLSTMFSELPTHNISTTINAESHWKYQQCNTNA